MTCATCGADCTGRWCQFCAREHARDGDWQATLTDDDTDQ
jgi:hypothetical protein